MHQVDLRPVRRRFETERLGRLLGEEEPHGEPGEGAVRRGGAPGVAGRRERDPPNPQRPRHRDRGRHPARLERAGGVQRFVFQQHLRHAERGPDERQRKERRHPLPQRDGVVRSGKDFRVTPERWGPRRDRPARHRARRFVEPVPGEQDAAATAQAHGPIRALGRAASRALEPLQSGRHAGLLSGRYGLG